MGKRNDGGENRRPTRRINQISDQPEQNVPVVIRPYEARDRAAIREICCDTADAGKPMESFFPDREILADLVTRYYTDWEPERTWVAEEGTQVVGYVTGCFNTRRFVRVMACWLVPVTFCRALGRGTLWHPQVLKLIRTNLRNWLTGGLHRPVSLRDYPAHLHINLRQGSRGQNLGRQLLERFFEQARTAGVSGIHLGVSSENENGQKFFEALGFIPLGRQGRFRNPGTQRVISTIVYGKRM